MPKPQAHSAEAFFVQPSHSFRLVSRPNPHGQPDHCRASMPGHGTFTDRTGRRHQADACASHAHDLEERRPSSWTDGEQVIGRELVDPMDLHSALARDDMTGPVVQLDARWRGARNPYVIKRSADPDNAVNDMGRGTDDEIS